ncbi:MAG TPA: CBS domain-containing protein [Candidatus Competibacteraceae bacterium]|nr:MAG: CBS domain-containing protein [Candidatus Competibacteraceae bacterium]HOB62767.1 CBS domain-containing protein [Candidatus Competibacteraceae bacterium]HQA25872.1 CBS domain-containing protein [Candidatus Competibacteraceae bacterium]HQD57060.1 CBS domain-containing protein [Candidatus Competibacteraceae bacterium]
MSNRNRTLRQVVAHQKLLVAAAPQTSVREASQLMKKAHVGALLVVERGHLVGIFTERDALVRVVAEGLSPEATPLTLVMTPNPITAHPDQPFLSALHLMYENGFRHVPVAENGRPLGMVSARDALDLEAAEFESTLHQREHLRTIMA